MNTRTSCTRASWQWAIVLRAWFVALLAFPALGVGPSPSAQAGLLGLDPGHEAVVRAAPPLPATDGKPVDVVAKAEAEEEEDASKRHGEGGLAHAAEHGVLVASLRAFESTAPECDVPRTPLLEHRLHNRGPPQG